MRKLLLLFTMISFFGAKAQSIYSLSLNGSSNNVVSNFDATAYTQLTIEMWLNPTTSTGNPLTWRPGSGPAMLWRYVSGTLDIYQGSGYYIPTTIPTGQWTHVALTWNGTTWTLYKNGISQGTQNEGWNNQGYAGVEFTIGGSAAWSGWFNGKIDEVRVWNTARTQSEIVNNMYNEISGSTTGLQLYHKFNDGSGTSANDETSNNYDGTINGTPSWVAGGPYNKWTGTTNSTWSTATNWGSGSVPISSEYVSIPSGTSNSPTVTASTSVNTLSITSGATLTVNSSQTLSVAGTLTNNGTITGNGNLELNGSSAQVINGTGSISNLTLNNSGGASINSSSATQSLTGTYNRTAGVLTTNGNLTLNQGGRIGQVSSGSISGNVNIEIAIPSGRRAYRLMGHPFSSAIAWTSLTDDIHITGTGGGANGFDASTNNNPSAFTFSETQYVGTSNSGFNACTNTANTIASLQAIRVFYRGPRSQSNLLDGSNPSPQAATIDWSGPVNQGTVNFSMTYTGANAPNAGWNLIPNPYASNVDIGSITSGNRNSIANFYVWVPGNGTRGAYVSTSFGGSYIIPSGSAFFVQTGSAANFTFSETDKTASAVSATLLKADPFKQSALQIDVVSDDTLFWDQLVIRNRENSLELKDNSDATKMQNPDVNFYSLTAASDRLAIDHRPISEGKVVNLGFENSSDYHFTLKVSNLDMPGFDVYLKDIFLNTQKLLSTNMKYDFVTTSDPNSKGNNRFQLVFNKNATAINEPGEKSNEFIVFPNPASTQITISLTTKNEGTYQFELLNELGQQLEKGNIDFGSNRNYTLNVENIQTGVYFIKVFNTNSSQTIKFIK